MDGLGAAMAVKINHAHTENIYHPGAYDQEPPLDQLAGKHVYLVDFSYSRDQLMKIVAVARTVTILDHHKTAQDDLQPFIARDEVMAWDLATFEREAESWQRMRHLDNRSPFIRAKFDMTKSGAVLAWEHFSSTPAPLFYRYLQDRDLWTKTFYNCDAVSWGLRSFEPTLDTWMKFFAPYTTGVDANDQHNIDKLEEAGDHIKNFLTLQIQEMSKNTHIIAIVKGGRTHYSYACASPSFMVSDLAGEIAKSAPNGWAACYAFTDKGLVVSLRSAKDEDGLPRYDVGELAKNNSCNGRGGGHTAASGFEVTDMTRVGFFTMSNKPCMVIQARRPLPDITTVTGTTFG